MTFTWLIWVAAIFMVSFFLFSLRRAQTGTPRVADEVTNLFLMISLVVYLGLWGSYQLIKSSTPLSVEPLGTLVDVKGGTIETTAGFYSVDGKVSGNKGDPVQRTYHYLGIIQICVVERCRPKA